MFDRKTTSREPLVVDAESFVVPRSFKAKGKRLTVYQIDSVNELEPTRFPQEEELPVVEQEEVTDTTMEEPEVKENMEDLRDEIVGQMKLFKD